MVRSRITGWLLGDTCFAYRRCDSVRAMTKTLIYHMCRADEWRRAEPTGRYSGCSQDAADGFIHFSTAAQIVESAAKHRAGQSGLVLLAVDPDALGGALKWESSRGGAL